MTNSHQYCKLPQYNEKGEPYPWKDEPNFAYYTDENTGLDYFINRHPILGFLCGSVIIKKTDVKLFPNELIDQEINGFFEEGKIVLLSELDWGFFANFPVWCISFHCGHAGDLVPHDFYSAKELKHTEKYYRLRFQFNTYRDIKYVQKECIKLVAQVADFLKTKKAL